MPVCKECLLRTVGPVETFCMICGNSEPCALHPGGPYCFSASLYGGATKDVVHAMKYEGARDIARIMGEALAGLASERGFLSADVLVPIPLHRGSERDYNQALAIARGAARIGGIPVADVLFWSGSLPRQAMKSVRSDRMLPRGAISSRRGLPPNTRVFLVDDVYTTGSTINAARKALEDDGLIVAGAMVWSRSRG